ncbi:heme A synthase [Arthrobacter sp. CAN_A6]
MTSRARRVALACCAGGGTFLLAGLAHVLSGRSLPAPELLAGLGVLTALAATIFSLSRLPTWAVLALFAVSQQVLHGAFTGLADGGASGATGVPGAEVPGHHEAPVPVPAGGASGHSPEAMILLHAHAAAALLAGLLVVRWSAIAAWIRSAKATAPEGGGRRSAVRGRQA